MSKTSKPVSIRFTTQELEDLTKLAAAKGCKPHLLIRTAALDTLQGREFSELSDFLTVNAKTPQEQVLAYKIKNHFKIS